jgi:6-pyruvoyltetrahydropterin/6-carboxytetrahydropterin synthase
VDAKKENFAISLGKASTNFNSSHMLITDHFEEGLHGHNYHIEVEIFGEIDNSGLIIDFLFLQQIVRDLVREWDHFVLIPKYNPLIRISVNSTNTIIEYGSRLYSIPTEEIKALDCRNVTAEELSRLLTVKIEKAMQRNEIKNVKSIRTKLWETSLFNAECSIDYKFE